MSPTPFDIGKFDFGKFEVRMNRPGFGKRGPVLHHAGPEAAGVVKATSKERSLGDDIAGGSPMEILEHIEAKVVKVISDLLERRRMIEAAERRRGMSSITNAKKIERPTGRDL